jgi:hypothetical protein
MKRVLVLFGLILLTGCGGSKIDSIKRSAPMILLASLMTLTMYRAAGRNPQSHDG